MQCGEGIGNEQEELLARKLPMDLRLEGQGRYKGNFRAKNRFCQCLYHLRTRITYFIQMKTAPSYFQASEIDGPLCSKHHGALDSSLINRA